MKIRRWNSFSRSGSQASQGFVAAAGPPTGGWGDGLMAGLNKVSRHPVGGALALPLLALGMLLVPPEKRRLVLDALKRAIQEHRRLPELNSRRRVRLPGYGWRAVTLFTIVALIGCDPAFNRLWTAQAQDCSVPINLSVDQERITEFVYDLDGRLTQVNSPEGVINYGYEEATGRHIRTCTKNSEVHYGYDELGRLKMVHVTKRNGSSVDETTTYTYTPVGSRDSMTLPNGVVTRYLYDSLNRLTNLTHKAGGTDLLASYSYQLHETGRRTNAVEIIKTEDAQTPWITNNLSWAYDGMYRLTNEVCVTSKAGASYTNRYEYDKVGNRHKKTRIANSATTTIDYAYNANDQLTSEQSSADGATSYGYDDNGSLIAKTNASATVLYGYNLANKLSQVTQVGSGVTNHFVYNDSEIRVRSWSSAGGSPTLFLVDANNHTGYAQVLEELTALGGTPTRSYVIGDDVLAQGSTVASYLLYDGHGSTRQLADVAGAVSSRYNYDAYGITESATSSAQAETSLLYCGEQYDSSLEMYNLRARYYNPANGRFNQRDAFDGNNEDPQSLHKYAYASGDPVNGIDPTGRFTLMELQVVIATLVVLSTVYLVGHAAAYNKAKARSATNAGREPILFGIEQGQIPKKGEWLSMSSEDRENVVNFWTSTGERLKQIQMVQDGNTIGAYQLAEAVNITASAADMGLNVAVGMAHAVPFVPNPYGKMGDPITQATTATVRRDFEAAGFEVTEQVKFDKGALGIKDRYVDIFAKHQVTDEKFLVQIGKMRKDGVPVVRERWAWDDIIFSPTIGKPEYKGSKFLFIEKGATGLPPGWNY